jgi:hypothetical protein
MPHLTPNEARLLQLMKKSADRRMASLAFRSNDYATGVRPKINVTKASPASAGKAQSRVMFA